MTIRIVTPADGSAGVSFSWDCGTVWQPRGALLDVPPGGALEAAIGLSNLTTLNATQLQSAVSGSVPTATSNA
jgi:hypothetical protein